MLPQNVSSSRSSTTVAHAVAAWPTEPWPPLPRSPWASAIVLLPLRWAAAAAVLHQEVFCWQMLPARPRLSL